MAFARTHPPIRTIFVLALTLHGAACQRLVDLKSSWHQGPKPPPTASLAIEVEPRQGLSIRLDGALVAQSSPYETHSLPAGSHVLEVRAMGYYTVTLPVVADANHPLHLPVRLRARAPAPFGPAPTPAPAPKGPSPEAAGATAGADAAPANLAARAQARAGRRIPLPGQTTPLHLSIEARPAAAIVVDGVAADADSVGLLQGQGTLTIGNMALAYRVRAGRGLELGIPHEGSRDVAWYVGGLQVKAKSQVRLTASPVVLRRVQGTAALEATVRRLD